MVNFHQVDRSESLINFIEEKTNHLHRRKELKWFISKEGHHEFLVKCVLGNHTFNETGLDLHTMVNSIVHRIKAKEEKYK